MIDRADIEKQTQAALATLQTVRDELRLRVHLGEMDLKEAWRKLSPMLAACERRGAYAKAEARRKLHDLTQRWQTIRGSLFAQ